MSETYFRRTGMLLDQIQAIEISLNHLFFTMSFSIRELMGTSN
ncbi:hypothetical protein PM8797T_14102 [Gimesia maris DSM 8797]|nr:hypothetical protein PM8797T_14102 [Gimesia maris DSM 8797]